jgi:hypothetical protein
VILGGSYARGQATPRSDLDLVILTTLDEQERLIKKVLDVTVDILVAPPNQIRSLMSIESPPILLSMMRDARILYAPDSTGAALIAEAARRWAEGPSKLSEAQESQSRLVLSQLLIDILDIPDDQPTQFSLAASYLIHVAIDTYFGINQLWTVKAKNLSGALMGSSFYLITAQLLRTDRPVRSRKIDAEAVVDSVLEPVGGRLLEINHGRLLSSEGGNQHG